MLAGKIGGAASTVTVGILVPTAAVAALTIPPSAVKRLASPLLRAQPDVLGTRALAKRLWRAQTAAGGVAADIVRRRVEEDEPAPVAAPAAAAGD
ncbi:MAG TPA: hypothetical protein VE615_02150, partial [Gaiellaceae bacterium]|nr:hypothetical protein [Gaiellaceae bacterium]